MPYTGGNKPRAKQNKTRSGYSPYEKNETTSERLGLTRVSMKEWEVTPEDVVDHLTRGEYTDDAKFS